MSNSFGRGVVLYNGASAIASGGGITIPGNGLPSSTANDNWGVAIETNSTVRDTGSGDITITGEAGSGTDRNRGVLIFNNSTVESNDGNITLNGTSGNSTGNFQEGILITNTSFFG